MSFSISGRNEAKSMSKTERRLLNIKEVAERLGIAQQTIYNGISRRTLRPFPIRPKRWGRKVLFDSLDVEKFIDALPYSETNPLDGVSSVDKKTPTENKGLQGDN